MLMNLIIHLVPITGLYVMESIALAVHITVDDQMLSQVDTLVLIHHQKKNLVDPEESGW